MSNNSNISPSWEGFRKLWIIVAILLFLLLLLLMLAGYSPWGTKCDVQPTIVEKVIEKEKVVDNPELLSKISLLEKENAEIAGLKTKVANLTKSTGLVAGLQAKVKTLEAIDLNFENPVLTSRIKLLETENSSIADMKKRIMELEAAVKGASSDIDNENVALTKRIGELELENDLIAGLKAKVSALEAVDINFMNPQDDSKLLQKINNLEVKAFAIPSLESQIKSLKAENPTLTKRIAELEIENGLIAGLKAKVSALEAVDINFMKSNDDSKLLQKINNLEVKTLAIPSLESQIQSLKTENPALTKRIGELELENALIAGLKAKVTALEAIDINFIKPKDSSIAKEDSALMTRIGELENQNGMIPGLKAKIKALEAIDINFIRNGSAKSNGASSSPSMMDIPDAAKLYFQPGSSRSPADVSQSMADVIVFLRSNPNSKVSLAGFHDAAGNANWNRRLATKRSNRVKQILVGAGVDASRISVEVPTQTLGTGSPEEARRVEVQLSK